MWRSMAQYIQSRSRSIFVVADNPESLARSKQSFKPQTVTKLDSSGPDAALTPGRSSEMYFCIDMSKAYQERFQELKSLELS